MKPELIWPHLLQLLGGIPLTLQLVGLALLFGLLIGSLIAFLRMSRIPVLWQAAYLYVYVIRGTPLLVQIFLIYFGLGQIELIRESFAWPVLRDEVWCAVIALAMNSGAYTSEVIRGGIQSIPHGQLEAALAYGMSWRTRLTRVILPQALRQLLPAYGNECISMVKASALASTITVMEVTGIARNLASNSYAPIETFLAAGLIYFGINFIIARLIGAAEAALAEPARGRA
jgi:octopine/nopaline transport system permease protein